MFGLFFILRNSTMDEPGLLELGVDPRSHLASDNYILHLKQDKSIVDEA
jgi:hypothetical protein